MHLFALLVYFCLQYPIFGWMSPLFKNGIQVELSPVTISPLIDSALNVEIFTAYNPVYLRGKTGTSGFNTSNFFVETSTGIALDNGWLMGIGIDLRYEPEINTTGFITTPLVQVCYESPVIQSFLQIYLNGKLTWGARLSFEAGIPFQLGVLSIYNDKPELQLNLALLPEADFKTGIFYNFLGNYAGIDFSILFKSKVQIKAEASYSFSLNNIYHFGLYTVLFFNENTGF